MFIRLHCYRVERGFLTGTDSLWYLFGANILFFCLSISPDSLPFNQVKWTSGLYRWERDFKSNIQRVCLPEKLASEHPALVQGHTFSKSINRRCFLRVFYSFLFRLWRMSKVFIISLNWEQVNVLIIQKQIHLSGSRSSAWLYEPGKPTLYSELSQWIWAACKAMLEKGFFVERSKLTQAQELPLEDQTLHSCCILFMCLILLNTECKNSEGWEHTEKLVGKKPRA